MYNFRTADPLTMFSAALNDPKAIDAMPSIVMTFWK